MVTQFAVGETQAEATSESEGTNTEAGVSVSANDISAMSTSWAISSNSETEDKSSKTYAYGEGQKTNTIANSLSNSVGSISSSIASAIGDIISVFSSSSASGKYVGGIGSTEIHGSQTAETLVEVSVDSIESDIYTVTVTAFGSASGDAQGYAWTMAYGGDIPFNNIINPPPAQIIEPVKKEQGFFGYTFGKCDVQRYKHFWLQLKNNNTEDDARALYWMQIIAGENTNYPNGELAMQVFEERYNITNSMPPNETNGNGIENGKWCTLPNNGIHK